MKEGEKGERERRERGGSASGRDDGYRAEIKDATKVRKHSLVPEYPS